MKNKPTLNLANWCHKGGGKRVAPNPQGFRPRWRAAPNSALRFCSCYVLVLSAQVFNCDSGPRLAKGGRSYYVPASKPERPRIFLPGRWGDFARYSRSSVLRIPMAERSSNAVRDARQITIRGAREHNLKNIDVAIPRDRLVVFTGLSGSGKSSLAFDTIYAEGQRRYVESLSAYARQFLEMMQKPDVDQIDGLSPAISIEQKTTSKNPRSTVGTVTEIYDYMRLLWARVGVPYSPATGLPIESQTVSQMVDRVLALPEGTRIYV